MKTVPFDRPGGPEVSACQDGPEFRLSLAFELSPGRRPRLHPGGDIDRLTNRLGVGVVLQQVGEATGPRGATSLIRGGRPAAAPRHLDKGKPFGKV
jgi:hypothetical protein